MFRTACLAVLLASACTDSSSGISQSELTCPTGSTLTYETFGQVFISTNCLSCHASRERPQLNTQAQVAANKQSIIDQAVLHTYMPEDSDMAIEDRRQLGEWLTCGAP